MSSSRQDEDLTGRTQLLGNVVSSWLGYFVVFATGFFLPRVIDMKLGQFQLGIWDFCWTLVSYLGFVNLGIGSALNRYIAVYRASGKTHRLKVAVSTVIVIQQAIALLVVVASLAASHFIPQLLSNRFGSEVETAQTTALVMGLSVAVLMVFDVSRGILTGCHRWDIFNLVNTATQALSVLVMIVALYQGYGLVAIAVVYLACMLMQGLIRAFAARRICPDARFSFSAVSPRFAREILTFGLAGNVMGLIPLIIIQGTFLLVTSTLGPATLPLLARPLALLRGFTTLMSRFTFILAPMAASIIATQGKQEMQRFALESLRYSLAVTVPFIVVFCCFGSTIMRLWMGDNYTRDFIIVALGLGNLLPLALSPLQQILVGMGRHKRLSLLAVATAALLFVVFGSLLYSQGWSADAAALLIALIKTCVSGLLIPIVACRLIGIPVFTFVRTIIPIPLAGGLAGTVFLAGLSHYNQSLSIMIAGVISYLSATVLYYWHVLLDVDARAKIRSKLSRAG
jgi:O-antigen/teichoic acid export membrane protein